MTMKKPPVDAGGGESLMPAVSIATPAAAVCIWHIAAAIDHLISAFPDCPSWISQIVDRLNQEAEALNVQEAP